MGSSGINAGDMGYNNLIIFCIKVVELISILTLDSLLIW